MTSSRLVFPAWIKPRSIFPLTSPAGPMLIVGARMGTKQPSQKNKDVRIGSVILTAKLARVPRIPPAGGDVGFFLSSASAENRQTISRRDPLIRFLLPRDRRPRSK